MTLNDRNALLQKKRFTEPIHKIWIDPYYQRQNVRADDSSFLEDNNTGYRSENRTMLR